MYTAQGQTNITNVIADAQDHSSHFKFILKNIFSLQIIKSNIYPNTKNNNY